ncbi:MAG: SCO family protein [Pseudomonadota bacterium]
MSDASRFCLSARRRIRGADAFRALAGVLFSCFVLASCSGGGERGALPPNPNVMALTDGKGANKIINGEYALTDYNGVPATPDRFAGKITIIYFGFASCPDVCPLALGRLSAALNELGAARLDEIAPLFITVDPKRDTPEALKAYLSFDDRIIGLTGDEAASEAARQSFKVYASEEPMEGSALGYTVDHSSLFYLIDRDGTPLYALQDTMTPTEIADVLKAATAWPSS